MLTPTMPMTAFAVNENAAWGGDGVDILPRRAVDDRVARILLEQFEKHAILLDRLLRVPNIHLTRPPKVGWNPLTSSYELRGAQIALIPQEPMAAFSPVHTVGAQIIEAIMLHERIKYDEARDKTLKGNYARLFDAARVKVRAWERAPLASADGARP